MTRLDRFESTYRAALLDRIESENLILLRPTIISIRKAYVLAFLR